MEYGSLANKLCSYVKSPEPKIGMGATELLWTDRHAYEIVGITDKTHIKVRRMKAVNSACYENDWTLSSDPDGEEITLFLYSDGWHRKEGKQKLTKFIIGRAEEYYDWSF